MTNVRATLFQVAIGVEEGLGQFGYKRRRRIIGNKMPSEFFADVLCRRRIPRQVGKHGPALFQAVVGVMPAEYDLIARFMETPHEDEFAAMDRLLGTQPGPAGEDLREIRHIGLAVTAADAKRVQFERLACEILN